MEIQVEEYERLKRAADGEPKLCIGLECEYQKIHNKKAWSLAHFKVGMSKIIASPEFWIYLFFAILFIIFAPKDVLGVWICFAGVTVGFMFFKPLSSLIARGNLNVNAGVGIQKNINQ